MKLQHLLPLSIAVIIAVVDGFVVPRTASPWTRAVGTPLVMMQDDNSAEHHASSDDQQRAIQQLLFEQQLNNIFDLTEVTGGPTVEEAEHIHGMPWKDTIGKSEYEDSLLYMPFWEWQMDFMKSSLTNLRVAPKEITDEQSYQENTAKKARIVSQCFQSDEYRKIRMTYYDAGDNTQVFNAVFYPRPEYDLPVLGVDLLAFNRQKYLAIVDFQPLYDEGEAGHETKFEHLLEPIRDSYESLQGRMSAKFYDETKFFSQQMLFARFEDSDVVMRDLFPAFQQYLHTHLGLFQQTTPKTKRSEARQVLERQRAYDTYSAQRDPATGLFTAMFGAEWADKFVYDFLFSMGQRPTKEEAEAIRAAQKAARGGGGGGGGNPFAGGNNNGAGGPPPNASASQQQQSQPARTEATQPTEAVARRP